MKKKDTHNLISEPLFKAIDFFKKLFSGNSNHPAPNNVADIEESGPVLNGIPARSHTLPSFLDEINTLGSEYSSIPIILSHPPTINIGNSHGDFRIMGFLPQGYKYVHTQSRESNEESESAARNMDLIGSNNADDEYPE